MSHKSCCSPTYGSAAPVDFLECLLAADVNVGVADRVLRYVFAPLGEIEYLVVALIDFDGLTQQATADVLASITGEAFSRSKIQRIHAQALKALRREVVSYA